MDAKSRALDVPCPFCGVEAGQSCLENGAPYPPHRARVMLVHAEGKKERVRWADAPSLHDQIIRERIAAYAERMRTATAAGLTARMLDDVQIQDVANERSAPAATPTAVAHPDQPVRFVVQRTYNNQREWGDDDQAARARVHERVLAKGGEAPTEAEMDAAAARYEAKVGAGKERS